MKLTSSPSRGRRPLLSRASKRSPRKNDQTLAVFSKLLWFVISCLGARISCSEISDASRTRVTHDAQSDTNNPEGCWKQVSWATRLLGWQRERDVNLAVERHPIGRGPRVRCLLATLLRGRRAERFEPLSKADYHARGHGRRPLRRTVKCKCRAAVPECVGVSHTEAGSRKLLKLEYL